MCVCECICMNVMMHGQKLATPPDRVEKARPGHSVGHGTGWGEDGGQDSAVNLGVQSDQHLYGVFPGVMGQYEPQTVHLPMHLP